MDNPLMLVIVAAVVIAGLAIYLVTHKATETKIVSVVEAEVAALKSHFTASAPVQALEAKIEPGVRDLLEELHAKIDAIRKSLGGAFTEAEKSQAVQAAEAKLKALETAVLAGVSAAHDLQSLRDALAGQRAAAPPPDDSPTPPIVPSVVPQPAVVAPVASA